MVQSKAKTVDAYLDEADAARAPHLEKLRTLAKRVLKGYEERMEWGMPAYLRAGKAGFAFASQKQYLALYFLNAEVFTRHAAALKDLDHGKGCLRVRDPEKLDWTLVERMLKDTRALADDAVC